MQNLSALSGANLKFNSSLRICIPHPPPGQVMIQNNRSIISAFNLGSNDTSLVLKYFEPPHVKIIDDILWFITGDLHEYMHGGVYKGDRKHSMMYIRLAHLLYPIKKAGHNSLWVKYGAFGQSPEFKVYSETEESLQSSFPPSDDEYRPPDPVWTRLVINKSFTVVCE